MRCYIHARDLARFIAAIVVMEYLAQSVKASADGGPAVIFFIHFTALFL
jgi:hypothetical protein